MNSKLNRTPSVHALFINCTLKTSPAKSNTESLINKSIEIMQEQQIGVELVRAADRNIRHSVDPELDSDDWPGLFRQIKSADIFVIGSPIWLGDKSSIAGKIIERLYAHSAETNKHGQYIYYNKVGGVMVTGNEDGGKHVSRDILYALSHIGFTIPPQADCYWVGEAGPGPSYMEAGQENEFTIRNTRIMTWNLIHFARQLKATPIPAEGNILED
jgi:multimeric flavodoxin WrbA